MPPTSYLSIWGTLTILFKLLIVGVGANILAPKISCIGVSLKKARLHIQTHIGSFGLHH